MQERLQSSYQLYANTSRSKWKVIVSHILVSLAESTLSVLFLQSLPFHLTQKVNMLKFQSSISTKNHKARAPQLLKIYQLPFGHIKINFVNNIRGNKNSKMNLWNENNFVSVEFSWELNLPIKAYSDKGANRCGCSHGLQGINQSTHDSTIRKGPRDDLAKVERDANQQDR